MNNALSPEQAAKMRARADFDDAQRFREFGIAATPIKLKVSREIVRQQKRMAKARGV